MFFKCIDMMIQGGYELQRDLRKINYLIYKFYKFGFVFIP